MLHHLFEIPFGEADDAESGAASVVNSRKRGSSAVGRP
jgi:hypothetical protein